MTETLIGSEETAIRLGITESKLAEWNKSKKLVPFKKVDGKKYYAESQVKLLMHTLQQKPKEESVIARFLTIRDIKSFASGVLKYMKGEKFTDDSYINFCFETANEHYRFSLEIFDKDNSEDVGYTSTSIPVNKDAIESWLSENCERIPLDIK